MRKITSFILICSFIILSYSSISQTILNGIRADKLIKGAEMIRMNDQTGVPSFIKFRKGSEVSFDKLNGLITNVINPTSEFGYKLIKSEKDNLGYVNYRYYQTYQSYALQNGMFIVHVKDGKIISINGDINKQISIANTITLSEDAALQQALSQINASKYKWQIPEEEQFIKKDLKDPKATYYPKGEIELYYDNATQKYFYTYKFDIYASKPLMRADCYVDASNGKILFKNSKIHFADVPGTAVTKYSGTRAITTDSLSATDYILNETSRGGGIETYNMLTTTSYASAVDFHDTDNNWNNVNTAHDEVATDAHWAGEKTYDFYKLKFNRNSLDNNNLKLKLYVHYDVNYANAFWDGAEMNFGDGSTGSGMGPLTAVDICGHEMTHGVTSFTANLTYGGESGAMNEGFSDVMGTAIKFYAKPPQTATWQMGSDIGTVIRDLSNPKAYQLPNTYLGTYWVTTVGCTPSTNNDECGVHTNMGVLSYWYYLLCHGGSGTNDIGSVYNVTGIGMDSATAIAYRTLTTYLVPSSQYADARFYAIQAATDLYGACSQAMISTTNAMYAVGVGAAFVQGVSSNFSADLTTFCNTPATINFTNLSNNCTTFNWDFGDGTTSTSYNPSHVYNTFGSFNVKLVATGGCGSDSITKTAFVSVAPTNPCTYDMPASGLSTISSCNGILLDNGGTANYIDNTNPVTTIAPTGATSLTLTFTSFSYETNYDYLNIYNGADTLSPLIGSFTGTALPQGGTITAFSGKVTIKQKTDIGTTMSGFIMNWQAVFDTNAATVCNFKVSDTTSCDGLINFTDLSSNCPNGWFWSFGDGTTDIVKNPTHVYLNNGTYNVKLKVINSNGIDSIIKNQLITISKPLDPTLSFTDTTHCGPTNFFITATQNGNGNLKWFDSPTSTAAIDTGSVFATPLISAPSTYYYVEMQQDKPSIYGGKLDSTGGTFQNYTQNTQRGIIFNCYAEAKLISVWVKAYGAGNRTIELWNSADSIILSKTVNIPNGISRVYLNFDLPIENNLKLYGPLIPNLYRSSMGNNSTTPYPYPYNINNVVSLITSTVTTGVSSPNNLYYYFYDWEVKTAPCKSNRVPVHIAIGANAPNASFTYNQTTGQFTNTATQITSYNWNFGDGSTSNLASPIHFYSANGTYTAKLVTTNSCGADSTTQSIVITNVSVHENSFFKDFNIYPNPTNKSVNITLTSATSANANIIIYDLLGNTIYSENITINTTEYYHKVDVSTFGKGIYFISLKSNNTTISKKLIVY